MRAPHHLLGLLGVGVQAQKNKVRIESTATYFSLSKLETGLLSSQGRACLCTASDLGRDEGLDDEVFQLHLLTQLPYGVQHVLLLRGKLLVAQVKVLFRLLVRGMVYFIHAVWSNYHLVIQILEYFTKRRG